MSENKNEQPWVLEPSFNKADIDVVMQNLISMSHTLKESINDKYDWPWTLGTKKYGWAVHCIDEMSLSNKYPFLGIARGGLGQIFTLNGVKVSIVTDDLVKRRKEHRYEPSSLEQHQFDLFKEGDEIGSPLVWRLVLDISIPHKNEIDFIFQPIIALIGLKNNNVVSSYSYNEVFTPTVVFKTEPTVLPQESQSKPVKLKRRAVKSEADTKQVNE